jgi:exoribonuclease R
MSRNLYLLEKHLKRKRKYSIKELKEALHIISDEDLMTLNVELLQRELETFNLNTENSCHSFLFRCFDYLNWHKSKLNIENEKIFKEISLKLIPLNKLIDELINKPVTIANKDIYDENINQLIRIAFKIDDFIEEHYKEEANENNKNLYHLMKHLLFEVKSLELVKEILKQMPNIKRMKNEKDISILDELVDKYVILLKKDNSLDEDLRTIIYYEKVIDLFTKSYHDKSSLKIIKEKMENEYYSVRGDINLDENIKRRIIFHFQEVISTILENKKSSTDNLIYKYNAIPNMPHIDDVDLKKVSLKDYQDLTKLNTFTIDDASTKCMEDAISFKILKNEQYEVSIYVTDVDSRIVEGSRLDKEIEKRALTVSNKKTELFSRKVALENLALIKNKNSLVIAFKFIFDKYGKVVSFDINKAIINVKENYSYESYKEKLKDKSQESEELTELSKLFCVVHYNNNNDNQISVAEFNKLKLVSNSNLLVSSYSIFLNEYMANYCEQKKVPFIFRSDKKTISNIIDDQTKDTLKVLGVIENTTLPIYNSALNNGIKVLKKESYGCVTNPVREYDALINQRMIKKFLIPNFTISYNDYLKANHYITYLCHFLEEKSVLETYYKEELKKTKVTKSLTKRI